MSFSTGLFCFTRKATTESISATAPMREGVGARSGRPLLVLSEFSCKSGLRVPQTDRGPAASQSLTTAPYPSHEGVHGPCCPLRSACISRRPAHSFHARTRAGSGGQTPCFLHPDGGPPAAVSCPFGRLAQTLSLREGDDGSVWREETLGGSHPARRCARHTCQPGFAHRERLAGPPRLSIGRHLETKSHA